MSKQIQEFEPTGYMVINGTEIPLYEGEYFSWGQASKAARGIRSQLSSSQWGAALLELSKTLDKGALAAAKLIPVSALERALSTSPSPGHRHIAKTVIKAYKSRTPPPALYSGHLLLQGHQVPLVDDVWIPWGQACKAVSGANYCLGRCRHTKPLRIASKKVRERNCPFRVNAVPIWAFRAAASTDLSPQLRRIVTTTLQAWENRIVYSKDTQSSQTTAEATRTPSVRSFDLDTHKVWVVDGKLRLRDVGTALGMTDPAKYAGRVVGRRAYGAAVASQVEEWAPAEVPAGMEDCPMHYLVSVETCQRILEQLPTFTLKKRMKRLLRMVEMTAPRSEDEPTPVEIPTPDKVAEAVSIPSPADLLKPYAQRHRVVREVVQQLEDASLDVLEGVPVTARSKVDTDARKATEIAHLVCKQFQAAGWSASYSPESNGTGIYLTFTLTDARRVAPSEHQQEAV